MEVATRLKMTKEEFKKRVLEDQKKRKILSIKIQEQSYHDYMRSVYAKADRKKRNGKHITKGGEQ